MAEAGGWEPACWVGICCAAGRCGGHGCGRNCSWVGGCSGSAGNTGWHILVFAQGVLVVDVVNIYCMPVWIMMVSMIFKYSLLNLSMCCSFILLCLWSFILLMNNLLLSRSKSGS